MHRNVAIQLRHFECLKLRGATRAIDTRARHKHRRECVIAEWLTARGVIEAIRIVRNPVAITIRGERDMHFSHFLSAIPEWNGQWNWGIRTLTQFNVFLNSGCYSQFHANPD